MGEDRLQKIMSRAGIASRRKSEKLIEAGQVTVNGEVAELGDKADPETDHIKVRGKLIPPPVPDRYFLLYKPREVVSTRDDPHGRTTVLDLIPSRFHKALVPVGRLDYHTEGLLLLTTDGDWAHRIAHPSFGCPKIYEVKVRGVPDKEGIERLRWGGMEIQGSRIRGAEVELLRTTGRGDEEGNSWWRVEIQEGKTRQIREMFYRIGHPVQKLRRIAVGSLTLSGLRRGQWRELTPREVDDLARAGQGAKRQKGRGRNR